MRISPSLLIAALFLPISAASAQNTSGVPEADVVAGEKPLGYRAAYSFEDGGADGFAHRFHYQQSLGDDWRLRLIFLQSVRGGGSFEFRSAQVQAQRQLFEAADHGGWSSAVRFDGVIPLADGQPGRARVDWINTIDLDDRWQARGVLLIGREVGAAARDGFGLETRAEATYKFDNGVRLGAQLFDSFNTTASCGSFDEQSHQLGFVIKGGLARGLTYNAGALFGLSRAAADVDLRLFLDYSL